MSFSEWKKLYSLIFGNFLHNFDEKKIVRRLQKASTYRNRIKTDKNTATLKLRVAILKIFAILKNLTFYIFAL